MSNPCPRDRAAEAWTRAPLSSSTAPRESPGSSAPSAEPVRLPTGCRPIPARSGAFGTSDGQATAGATGVAAHVSATDNATRHLTRPGHIAVVFPARSTDVSFAHIMRLRCSVRTKQAGCSRARKRSPASFSARHRRLLTGWMMIRPRALGAA
jgi:hypothetical protein